ncbi:class I SAM-dependent methyltransferase [Gloeomargarita lithophora]|uniref:class I SAM-dependent methyltransferase n=1 Tax=Gloeomargarita lithophora TaxID=1188228 RepID=UPI001C12A445|nr:class I SAM-dependent methyltransferase [Gloeomargarita lithophora]
MPETIRPGEVFAQRGDFDRGIRTLLSHYDQLLTALSLCVPTETQRVLDLGCGTGNLSARILQRLPQAQITAMDYSPQMLCHAQAKLPPAQTTFITTDFGVWALHPELFPTLAPVDACVSSLAIHHLTHDMKQQLFRQIFAHLRPGGCFWNADPVLAVHPQSTALYQRVRQELTPTEPIPERGTVQSCGYSSQDQLATLAEHLDWLKAAGFAGVDAVWQYFGWAIFGGYVPE